MAIAGITSAGRQILSDWALLIPAWLRIFLLAEPRSIPLHFDESLDAPLLDKAGVVVPTKILSQPAGQLGRSRLLVDVYLPIDFCLIRRRRLPPTGENALRSALALDLQRSTPMATSDVVWTHQIAENTDDTVSVNQAVAKLATLDMIAANLLKSGFQARRFCVAGMERAPPLHDLSAKLSPMWRFWRRLNATLMALISICGTLAVLYPAQIQRIERQTLETQIADLRAEALRLRTTLNAKRGASEEKSAFTEAMRTRQLLIVNLRSLTVQLPDNAWITDLEYRPPNLTMNGFVSGSAADLVLGLSGAPGLGNARLNGPVSPTADGAERFGMSMTTGN